MLKKNISNNNLKNVHIFNTAITDKNGHINFYYDEKDPGSLVMSTRKQRISHNKRKVKATSLSSFILKNKIKNIDFLKMDIEGSETSVIPSLFAHNLLPCIDKACIEYHHKISHQVPSQFGKFLNYFENTNFEYQIDTRCFPINSESKYQDVLIYLYKTTS